jgi:hypothetical protein
MAQTNPRSSSKQKKSSRSSNSKPASSGTKAKSSGSKASASTRRSSSAPSRNRAASSRDRASSSGGGNGNGEKQKSGTSKLPLVAGLATGAAGLLGGAVLGTRLAKKPKRILGVPVPGTGNGLNGLVKQVGKAGKQFQKATKQVSELTDEVRAAREKAEEVGRAIS